MNNNQQANQTIKETTIQQPDNLTAYNNSINQPYMNNNQLANQTIKQTTNNENKNLLNDNWCF